MTSDSDNIISLYERRASEFAKERTKKLFERPWLDKFLALVPAAGTVLDIGCGFGEPIARYLIENGRAVTGVDSSPAMISMCEKLAPNETWIVGDMRKLNLERRFQGVLAWDSFFHLTRDDQRSMFPIFASHAEAGAPLMFTSGPRDGEAIGSFHGEPLYHSSLSAEEYRKLLALNGFEVVEHVERDERCGDHTIWLAQRCLSGSGKL